jgi:hypothetical protein
VCVGMYVYLCIFVQCTYINKLVLFTCMYVYKLCECISVCIYASLSTCQCDWSLVHGFSQIMDTHDGREESSV